MVSQFLLASNQANTPGKMERKGANEPTHTPMAGLSNEKPVPGLVYQAVNKATQDEQDKLKSVAKDNVELLQQLVSKCPGLAEATLEAAIYNTKKMVPKLDQGKCPKFNDRKGTQICVFNQVSF